MNSMLGTIRPSGLLPPNLLPANLFSALRLKKTSSQTENQEHLLQSSVIFSILIHIADIKRDLSDGWDAFSKELRALLEPMTAVNSPEGASARQLCTAVDAVVQLCKSRPETRETMEYLLEKVDTTMANVALPSDWKVREDMLTNFHRLYDYAQRGEDRMSDSADNPQGFMDIPIWYGTCRQLSGNSTAEAFYGTERADEVSMGLVRVSIPDFDSVAKSRSDLPYGWFWDRARQLKDRDGLVITKCIGMDEAHVKHHMAQNRLHVDKGLRGKKRGNQRSWEKARNEACVFVHGFKFGFGTTARKMALCAYKIQEDAPLFMFSWPSYQAFDSYSADEGNAMWAVSHFVDFLTKLLTQFQLDKVHLIGHSMGTRIILYALTRLGLEGLPEGAAKLGRLVLAAPDFDLGEFHQIQARLCKTVEHITIYASSNDQALNVSARIHGGHPRLGTFPSTPGTRPWHLHFAENVDLVDATGLDKSILGHGYVFSVPGVLSDACEFLRDGIPAEKRQALKSKKGANGFRYYTFQGVAEEPESWAEIGEMDESLDAEVEAWAEFRELGSRLPENSQKKLAKFFGDDSTSAKS